MQLTDREKKLIIAGSAFFIILVVYFGVSFVKEDILSIDEKIRQSSFEDNNLINLGKEYKKLASLRSMEKVDIEPMVPQIESMLQKYGVRNNATLLPTDSVIENKFIKRQVSIDFKEIDSASILNIVKEIEESSSIPYSIEFFQSSEITSKPGLYRISLKVAAFKNKE
ncbi:MAG: hypothetical protein OEV66_02380 [Spirochaetia bacterium]|nr:hypothetical protein [Spirochaetia bacterium]